MGDLWELEKEGLENFGGFQAMNIGIMLVISFWPVPLVLGGPGYERRRSNKI